MFSWLTNLFTKPTAINLAEKLRTMRMARAQDGESFAVLTSNPQLPTSIQLDLRLIEADQVCTPDLTTLISNGVDGIVFDAAGNPVEYHVLKSHPGESVRVTRDYDRLPSEAVVHWFRADRPGQGESYVAKALGDRSRSPRASSV